MENASDAQIMRRARNGRDKVSNGTRILPKTVDLRSANGRRFKHLVAEYSAELGQLSEPDMALIRQAVALQLQSEAMQAAIVRGETIDPDALIRVSSTSKRLLSVISAKADKRKPANGPTSLAEYLASKAAQSAADEPETTEAT